MSLLAADPLPIRIDDDGTYRVGGTRVTLDVVLDQHLAGKTPEQIVTSFPSLKLADVYGVISYALNHAEEVENYLRGREREAQALRTQMEDAGATPTDTTALRAKLQSKMQSRTNS
ncbi:MAG: DUF433 domain-containing protein [Pirellulaceae bacterium]